MSSQSAIPRRQAASLWVDKCRPGSGNDRLPHSSSFVQSFFQVESGIGSLPLPVQHLSTIEDPTLWDCCISKFNTPLFTRFCLAIFGVFVLGTASFGQDDKKIITAFDRNKNTTTVKMLPVKVSGAKDKYHSLHISPVFSYAGQPTLPETIDFELLTVVKGKLRVDLYVVFLVDGETIFLSSNRSGIKRPVPGRNWMGERLVFRMPYQTFLKIAAAKTVAVKLDAVQFEFGEEAMRSIRAFAKHIKELSR